MAHLGSRAIEAMAGKSVSDWLSKEQMRVRVEQETPRKLAPLPLIVISRLKASRGTEVAEAVASDLGYDLLDRAFINTIAERAEMRQEVVALVDERIRKNLFSWLVDLRMTNQLSNDAYFLHLLETVGSISKLGAAVLVGRGANFILKPEDVFRVRVYAPTPLRVEYLMEKEHLSRKQAEGALQRVDRERREFVDRWFHRDINQPDAYDLGLNMAFLDVEGAARVIVAGYLAKFRLTIEEIRQRLKLREPVAPH